MYPASSPDKHLQWTRDDFFISTDPSMIDTKALNAAFGSDDLYWAKALPEDHLKLMLENSLNFGLYSSNSSEDESVSENEKHFPRLLLIGYARLITDNVTFAWLTDVYVLEQWRGKKLGEWLVGCVQETLDQMPWLRRSMAVLGDKGLAHWYEKNMGMKIMETGSGMWAIQRKGRGTDFG